MNSDSAIFCFGEENMNSYEENEKRKDGAKIQFCAVFPLCAKTIFCANGAFPKT
jgi:hypothetical protein